MRAAPLSIRPRRAPSTEAMFFSGPTTSTVLVLIMIIIIIIIMIGEMSASDVRLTGGLESFFGWRPTLDGPGKILVTRPKTLLMIPVINHLLCFELCGVKSRIHLSIQKPLRQVSVAANRNHDERVFWLGHPPPPHPPQATQARWKTLSHSFRNFSYRHKLEPRGIFTNFMFLSRKRKSRSSSRAGGFREGGNLSHGSVWV